MVRHREQVHVREDVSLGVQEERVTAAAGRKLLDVVGGHGVQQAHAVLPAGDDLAPRGEIQPRGGFTKSTVTRSHKLHARSQLMMTRSCQVESVY